MLNDKDIKELKKFAKESRINIVKMVYNAQSGHIGGALSSCDIMTVLYHKCMKLVPKWTKDKNYESRDRFVLSKGHASTILYSVLAQCGYFKESELMTFRKLGTMLQGHPFPMCLGVEVATGSLGQGLSLSCGIALSLKLDKNPAHVFTLMGDGELQEGSCWEGFMNGAHHKLNNLTAIIDRNRLQIDGGTETVKGLDNLEEKIKAFNWNVIVIDGHDYNQIYDAIELSKKSTDKPTAIIANTIKGKGVSFMENQAGWHGKAPKQEEFERAMKELEAL
ncbi:MAG: transketolase [Clostridiaceae bacterium]|nr:transketolase [Clostridiaceae bacterium]